jgi:hypothetical protein
MMVMAVNRAEEMIFFLKTPSFSSSPTNKDKNIVQAPIHMFL